MERLGTTWLWLAIAIAAVARTRGRPAFIWFVIGLFTGPIGLLVLLVIPALPLPVLPPLGLRTNARQDFLIGLLYVGLGLLGLVTFAVWMRRS
jgi:hypothetical protein